MDASRGCNPHADGAIVLGRHMRGRGGVRRNAWQALVDEPVRGPRVETRPLRGGVVARLEGVRGDGRRPP